MSFKPMINELIEKLSQYATGDEFQRPVEQVVELLESIQQQEPVAWHFCQNGYWHFTDEKRDWYDAPGVEEATPLYARCPIPDDVTLADAERYAFIRSGALYIEPGDGEIYVASDRGVYTKTHDEFDAEVDRAMT